MKNHIFQYQVQYFHHMADDIYKSTLCIVLLIYGRQGEIKKMYARIYLCVL